jgi:hypothetical protein
VEATGGDRELDDPGVQGRWSGRADREGEEDMVDEGEEACPWAIVFW